MKTQTQDHWSGPDGCHEDCPACADELLEALESIHTLASCAPHDDEERANKEFTRIMLTARAAIAKAKGGAQ